MKRFFCGMVALGLFGHLTGPAKADYFYSLIDFPGSTVTQALGINNAGQIVGRYAGRDLGHGFLLSPGTYTAIDVPNSLGGPFGVDFTVATGINATGQIVGWYEASQRPPPFPSDVGFLLSGGNYSAFSATGPSIGATTQALGMNDSVQIVGSVQRLVNGTFQNTRQAFLISGTSSTLFDPPGAVNSVASGINNAQQIVGHYQTVMGGPDHGFLLSNGVYTTLDVPGAFSTDANGINTLGQIVGDYTDASGRVHGFLYSDGAYTTFEVPNAFSTDPNGINDLGQVVGSYQASAGDPMLGFLASPVPAPSNLLLLSIATAWFIGCSMKSCPM